MSKYELYHHGILGMKWGIRRFQNEDGSLTAAGKKRYGSDLYKKLSKENNYDEALSRKYRDHELIKSIVNNKDRQKAYQEFRNTKYDGPKEEYDPQLDKKLISQAKKEFEHDMGRKFDPENRQDEKVLGLYIDELAEKTGAYKKAEKLNKAPSYDKAFNNYMKANEKAVKDALGSMSSQSLKNLYYGFDQEYWKRVESLISYIDMRENKSKNN